jgi:hypothetical protein
MASTTASDTKGSVGSLEAVFVVTVGGAGISEVVIVVVFINGVEDAGLCTSTGSRVGAQEAGVGGAESGGWVKTSTGGMRLPSSVARLAAVKRNGGDGNLDVALCAVLATSLDGLPLIWMRDAKELLDWLVDACHLPIELKSLPANCCKRVGLEDDLDWKVLSLAKGGGGVDVGDGVGER